MKTPAAFKQTDKIDAEVRAVEAELKPDVVRIRYDFAQDWAGDWAIYFRTLLSDEAAERRLVPVARAVRSRLEARLDFDDLDVRSYFRVRSASEQDALKDEAWV